MSSKPTPRYFCGLLNTWHCNQLICQYNCLDLPISFNNGVSLLLTHQRRNFCFMYEFRECRRKAAATSQGKGERARGKGKGEDKEVAQMRSPIAVMRS